MEKINKKFFLKNLSIFSLPLIIIIMILGSLSIVITERYVKVEIDKNNYTLVKQNKENIELMLNEINYLYLTFGINPDVTLPLKRIFNSNTYSFEDAWQMNTIGTLLNAASYSKPYINSIYIYFNNKEKNFLATSRGITNVYDFYDKVWLSSYEKNKNIEPLWTEVRQIRPYNFTTETIKVLTI